MNTYWSNTGMFQKEYDNLYDLHVPSSGSSNTIGGEIIRTISRIYYDYYNNGLCNLVQNVGNYNSDDSDDCVDCVYTISPFYEKMIDLVYQNISSIKSLDIKEWAIDNVYLNHDQFSDSQKVVLETWVNTVLKELIDTPNLFEKDLPDSYKKD
jgi:hypothetical protein